MRWRPRIVFLEGGEAAIVGSMLVCIDLMCGAVLDSIDSEAPHGPGVTLERGRDGAYHPYHGTPEWIF